MAVDDMLSKGQYVGDPLSGGNVAQLQYDPNGGVVVRPGGQANDEIVRAVMERLKGEPAMKGNMPSRVREGKPFYENFAPGGNSWMWFTGGSPFPVPAGVSELDALSEVIANGLAGYRYMQEQEERKRKKEGKDGGQTTAAQPTAAPIATPVLPSTPQPMAIPTPQPQPSAWDFGPDQPPLGSPYGVRPPAPRVSPQAMLLRRAYTDPYSLLLG